MEYTEALREQYGSITAAQSAELDAAAERQGVHVEALMRIAGWQVARCAWQRLGTASSILVCAGNGNNGGDALVAAQYLAAWGCEVHVRTFAATAPRSPLWTALHTDLAPCCASACDLDVERSAQQVGARLQDASLVIDGILGTGTRGAPRGTQREVIMALAEYQVPVLALDIPSGLDADTGVAADVCVTADTTCTLAAMKRGLWNASAAGRVGSRWVADIGMPASAWDLSGLAQPSRLRGGALVAVPA